MTTVYFVRHAQSDFAVRDDQTRPLTEKGLRDRRLITEYLRDKPVDRVLSSLYKRAVDTVADLAERRGLPIETIPDFREREKGGTWLDGADFWAFAARQWADFRYTLPGGECLAWPQCRNAMSPHFMTRCRGTPGRALSSARTASGT